MVLRALAGLGAVLPGSGPRPARRSVAAEPIDKRGAGGGANAFYAIRSYLITARQQDQPVLAVLRRDFTGDLWLPAAPAAA